MDILKDETTARLDDVTRLADEALTVYEALVDEIDDGNLRARVSDKIREQNRLLRALLRARQSREDLPQVASPERGHLFALVVSVKHFLANNDSPIVDKLIESNKQLREVAVAADEQTLPREERDLVERLVVSCDSLGTILGEGAATSRGK